MDMEVEAEGKSSKSKADVSPEKDDEAMIFEITEERALETFSVIEEEVPLLYQEAVDVQWPGDGLGPEDVRGSRKTHMKFLDEYDVYDEIQESEWKGRTVKGRWVDDWRDDAIIGGHARPRVVGKDYNQTDNFLVRYLMHFLSTDKRMCAMMIDSTMAYVQADLMEELARDPPADVKKVGILWKLKKAMPGVRPAGASWQDHHGGQYVTKGGFRKGKVEPCGLMNPETLGRMISHGDEDFVIGFREDSEKRKEWAHTHLHCKVSNVTGLGQATTVKDDSRRSVSGLTKRAGTSRETRSMWRR